MHHLALKNTFLLKLLRKVFMKKSNIFFCTRAKTIRNLQKKKKQLLKELLATKHNPDEKLYEQEDKIQELKVIINNCHELTFELILYQPSISAFNLSTYFILERIVYCILNQKTHLN